VTLWVRVAESESDEGFSASGRSSALSEWRNVSHGESPRHRRSDHDSGAHVRGRQNLVGYGKRQPLVSRRAPWISGSVLAVDDVSKVRRRSVLDGGDEQLSKSTRSLVVRSEVSDDRAKGSF
jgi:hypothetical protein